MKIVLGEVIKITGGDLRYTWDKTPEAMEGFREVSRDGWMAVLKREVRNPFPSGNLFYMSRLYFAVLWAIESYAAAHSDTDESDDD